MKAMLSEARAKKVLQITIPVFIMILSIFVMSVWMPKWKFVGNTLDSLDKSQETVLTFTGVVTAASVAITLIPDDVATPLADTLSDMDLYFVFVLIVIFAERLIVMYGIKIVFLYLIPIACGLYLLSVFMKKEFLKGLALRIAAFGLALIVIIPVSTGLSNVLKDTYQGYIDETIELTQNGADKLQSASEEDDDTEKSFFDKVSDFFQGAVKGIEDLLEYFNNVIKKCVNSIAILVVTNFVVPLLVFFLFRWLLKQLFDVSIPLKPFKKRRGLTPATANGAPLPEEEEADFPAISEHSGDNGPDSASGN